MVGGFSGSLRTSANRPRTRPGLIGNAVKPRLVTTKP
jgi:hypothetical protein